MKRIALLIIVLFIVGGCAAERGASVEVPVDFTNRKSIQELDLNTNITTITIGMIGDILLHNPLYSYENYDFAFAQVKDKLTSIDFLIANQESMPGGVELGLSGYPTFNSPSHIIRDLIANGVDMVSIANNHTIDRRETGIRSAIGYIKEYEMPYVGAYTSVEDQAEDRIVDVDGVRIGVLAYTYGTNGIPVPEGKDYLVSLIERERMQEEISRLAKKVDVMVVSMHWGYEYHLSHSKEQEELAQLVSDAGADVIFGHHPHVLQPYDEVGNTKVFYSLGNFYSAQQFDSTNIGGIARLTVTKTNVAGVPFININEPAFYPTAVIRDTQQRYTVIPLENAGSAAIYDNKWVESHLGIPSW